MSAEELSKLDQYLVGNISLARRAQAGWLGGLGSDETIKVRVAEVPDKFPGSFSFSDSLDHPERIISGLDDGTLRAYLAHSGVMVGKRDPRAEIAGCLIETLGYQVGQPIQEGSIHEVYTGNGVYVASLAQLPQGKGSPLELKIAQPSSYPENLRSQLGFLSSLQEHGVPTTGSTIVEYAMEATQAAMSANVTAAKAAYLALTTQRFQNVAGVTRAAMSTNVTAAKAVYLATK